MVLQYIQWLIYFHQTLLKKNIICPTVQINKTETNEDWDEVAW